MAFAYFDEFAGSPTFDLGINRSTAIREGKVPWDELNNFATYLFGGEVSVSLPTFPYLRASRLAVEPFVGDKEKITDPETTNLDADTLNEYAFAKVRVEYSTEVSGDVGSSSWGGGPDPVARLSHRWSTSIQKVSVASEGYEWVSGTTADGDVGDNVPISIHLTKIEHQVTWMRVPNPPFSVIRDRLGSVNDATLILRTGNAEPETLLFLGAELRRDVLTTGALAWEVSYRFSEKRMPLPVGAVERVGGSASGDLMTVGGWNHFLRSDARVKNKAGAYRIQAKSTLSAGGGTPVFPLKSFDELFVQGS